MLTEVPNIDLLEPSRGRLEPSGPRSRKFTSCRYSSQLRLIELGFRISLKIRFRLRVRIRFGIGLRRLKQTSLNRETPKPTTPA